MKLKDEVTQLMMSLKVQERMMKERIEVQNILHKNVDSMRSLKSRSHLYRQKGLFCFWLYKFKGPDYVELVEDGQKT
jgi:hypothetical protein